MNTNEILVAPDLEKIATRSFKLTRSGRSGFKKDGTGENGVAPEYLSSGKTMFIEPISRLFLGQGKGYRQTQYVIGASTHYTEDYYEDNEGNLVLGHVTPDQAKEAGYNFRPGLKSQGYNLRDEYARSMDLGICFEMGVLNVGNYSDDPSLLRFVMEYEQNTAAPRYGENKDRRRPNMFTFAPMVKELDAARSKHVENYDEDVEAMLMVQKIRTKKENGYAYNEDKLNALLAMLEEGVGLDAGDVVQKFKIISQYARRDGATFLSIVNTITDKYKMDVTVAEEIKVLQITATGVGMLKEKKYESVYTFKSAKSRDNCLDELITFMIGTPEGGHAYSEMIRLTEQEKIILFKKK